LVYERKQKWLTRFNEFTGAKWPALLNDISQFPYTPLIEPVNRQIPTCIQIIQAQQQFFREPKILRTRSPRLSH